MTYQSSRGEAGAEDKAQDRAKAIRRGKAHEIQACDRAFEVAGQNWRIHHGAQLIPEHRAEETELLDVWMIAGGSDDVVRRERAGHAVGTG